TLGFPSESVHAGVDAVQAAIHSDPQTVRVLPAYPVPQLVHAGCAPSTILLEHLEQGARTLELRPVGIVDDAVAGLVWHRIPRPCRSIKRCDLNRTLTCVRLNDESHEISSHMLNP